MSHLKGFFPSWTEETCLFNLSHLGKQLLQMSQLEGLSPSWTDLNYGFLNLQIPETTISESTDVSVHGVKKPFNCFPKWDKLKRHDSSVHEGKKPFKCDISNFHCSPKS